MTHVPVFSPVSPDGTLGRIAIRTRSAPRQLLQVQPGTVGAASPSTGQALLANLTTGGDASSQETRSKPLSHRSILVILEQVYDAVLDLEQLRRIQPGLLGTLKHVSFVDDESEEIGEVQAEKIGEATRALELW